MRLGTRECRLLLGLVVTGVVLSWFLNNSGFKPDFFLTVLGLFYPFILGLIFAYLFNIPMAGLERLLFKQFKPRARRALGFGLTLTLLLLFMGFVVFAVIPQLASSVVALATAMPGYLTRAKGALEPYFAYVPTIQGWISQFDIDLSGIAKQAAGVLQSGSTAFLNSAFGFASSLISGTVNFIIGIFFAASLLFSKERLLSGVGYFMQAYLPEKSCMAVQEVCRLANQKFSRFVVAESVEAMVLTVLSFAVFAIGGFKYALLLSVVVGLMSLVPIFGSYIALALGGFVTLVSSGGGRLLAFCIIVLVLQRVESSILFQHIVGDSIGLSPTWILIAVTLGGGLFGIPGVLLFIPLTSLLYTLFRRGAEKRRAAKGLPVEDAAVGKQRKSWRDYLAGLRKK